LARHLRAIERLFNTRTRGPKPCRSARRILLPVFKDSSRRHSYSGLAPLPILRRDLLITPARLRRRIPSYIWGS
jgi:hypothetical protein